MDLSVCNSFPETQKKAYNKKKCICISNFLLTDICSNFMGPNSVCLQYNVLKAWSLLIHKHEACQSAYDHS